MITSKKRAYKKKSVKTEPLIPSEGSDFISPQEAQNAKQNHDSVRRSASPEMLEVIHETDRVFAEIVGDLDTRLVEESKLREWGKNLCGFPMDISELEDLSEATRNLPKCGFVEFKAKRGVVFISKTQGDTIVNAQKYIYALENTLLDVDSQRSTLKTQVETFTNYSFFDLIKIAFKRLINRRK